MGATSVDTRSGLPQCGSLRRGRVYYVRSEGQLYYCDGQRFIRPLLEGLNDEDMLFSVEPAGAGECPFGGVEISAGVDADGDGELDAGEVDSSKKVCNGSDGADGSSCSVTTDADGRPKIVCEDGTSAVVPRGQDGADSNWIVSVEPASVAECPNGGGTISTGPDADGDGELDSVVTSQTICRGATGPAGPRGQAGPAGLPGADAEIAVRATRYDMLDECPAGGVLVEAGHDTDGDGELSDEEVQSGVPICDPEDSVLERSTPIPACAACRYGGRLIERGFDEDGDGELDDAEVLPALSSFDCHESS